MENKEEMNELKAEALEAANGGLRGARMGRKNQCMHAGKYRTGAQREERRWIFWSQHQFEYYCPE